jgi:hypothetical protein
MEMHKSHGYKQPVNEIEKYVPGIDSPEDEDEINAEFGIDEPYDVYKMDNPYSSIENDEFYDEKMDDIRSKTAPKMMDLGYKSIDIEKEFDPQILNVEKPVDNRSPIEREREGHIEYRKELGVKLSMANDTIGELQLRIKRLKSKMEFEPSPENETKFEVLNTKLQKAIAKYYEYRRMDGEHRATIKLNQPRSEQHPYGYDPAEKAKNELRESYSKFVIVK